MPSLLGPGTYLAWIITGIDAFWEQWAEFVPWRADHNQPLPDIQQNAHDSQEKEKQGNPVLQIIAFVAYAAVALAYLGVMIVKKMPSLEYAAHTEAFYLIINVVFVVAYPNIDKVFTFEIPGRSTRRIFQVASRVALKFVFVSTIFSASFNRLETFPKRLETVWNLGLFTAEFMSLIILNLMICRWSLHLVSALWIPLFSSLPFRVIPAEVKKDTGEHQRWSEKLSLRAPVPRTLNKLTELDQAFALGLAVASFLYSRRQTVTWIFKKVSLVLSKFPERAHRFFTKREI